MKFNNVSCTDNKPFKYKPMGLYSVTSQERLRILRFIFKDFNSEYNDLLKKGGTANLKDKRLQNMILTIFKCLHFSDYPRYLKDMFCLRSSTYFFKRT